MTTEPVRSQKAWPPQKKSIIFIATLYSAPYGHTWNSVINWARAYGHMQTVMTPGCRRKRWDKLTPVQICSQRGRTASLQRCWKPNYKWGGSFLRLNSLVDEVDCLGFQLVGAMQIGEDEDVGGVLHGQTGAERVLTHDFKSLQGVLEERRARKRLQWQKGNFILASLTSVSQVKWKVSHR